MSADSRDPTTLYIDVRYTIRGTENPPERHFCRRCAMSLAAAPAPAIPRPW